MDLAAALREIRECGVALLPGVVPAAAIEPMRCTAAGMLDHRDSVQLPDGDFPPPPASFALIESLMGCAVEWRPEHSWIRRKYAPANAPPGPYPNSWHQDGGLGVRFPAKGDAIPAMTRLATCWLALDARGSAAPGLEFVRRPLDQLLHFTELTDAAVAACFPERWAPELRAGDALVFSAGTLHRTLVTPAMSRDRISVEWRFFPTWRTPGLFRS